MDEDTDSGRMCSGETLNFVETRAARFSVVYVSDGKVEDSPRQIRTTAVWLYSAVPTAQCGQTLDTARVIMQT